MRYVLAVTLPLALVSCASSSQTFGPDGRVAHAINCSGTLRSWAACFDRAGEICQAAGYDVIDRSDQRGALAAVGSSGGFATTTFSRSMLISCKEPK
jgi:hypothetical protein